MYYDLTREEAKALCQHSKVVWLEEDFDCDGSTAKFFLLYKGYPTVLNWSSWDGYSYFPYDGVMHGFFLEAFKQFKNRPLERPYYLAYMIPPINLLPH